jgi:hypothetical protein
MNVFLNSISVFRWKNMISLVYIDCVGSEVLTAVVMKSSVLWYIYIYIYIFHCCEDPQILHTGWLSTDYTALYILSV